MLQSGEATFGAVVALSAGAWGFLGVLVVQMVVLVLAVFNAHNTREARKVAQSTNDSVNHIAPGEMKLIDRVRHQDVDIGYLKACQTWQVDVMVRVAENVGVEVPPIPVPPNHDRTPGAHP